MYSSLINRLLRNVEAAERYMEPLLGARIRDDVILTHRRESDRLHSLHGREQLRATITGNAWKLLEPTVAAESSLARAGTHQVRVFLSLRSCSHSCWFPSQEDRGFESLCYYSLGGIAIVLLRTLCFAISSECTARSREETTICNVSALVLRGNKVWIVQPLK